MTIQTCDACGEPETRLVPFQPSSDLKLCKACDRDLYKDISKFVLQIFNLTPIDLRIAGMRLQTVTNDGAVLAEIGTEEFNTLREKGALNSGKNILISRWMSPYIMHWFVIFGIKDDPSGRFFLFKFTFARPLIPGSPAFRIYIPVIEFLHNIVSRTLNCSLSTLSTSLPQALSLLSK